MEATEERATTLPVKSASTPAQLPAVEVRNATRRFGHVLALDDVSLSVQRGEFFSLLGPSGCGKTTLLRLIAGLDIPDAGTILLSGQAATGIPAHRRPVNTVFQSYALFPHLSVRENVSFGLRMKKIPEADLRRRVDQMMATLQIGELADRRPSQLSGGQMQRVALARAIVNEPQVLLLDEPLGALDLKLRKQLQVELHSLQRRLGMTFVYVTHDQEEALVMSDRIAVMNAGRIEQMGPARAVYERPRTRFVAQFLGSCNLLDATVTRRIGEMLSLRTAWGELQVGLDSNARAIDAGKSCTLALRPEKVRLHDSPATGEPNSVSARVVDLIYTGSETQYLLDAEGLSLRAWVLNTHVGNQGLQIGQKIVAHLPPAAMVLLDN